MTYEWLQHMLNFKFQVHHWRRALLSLIRSNPLACLWGIIFWRLEEYVMLWHGYVVCAIIYYCRVENVIKGWCLFVKTWPNFPVAFRRPFSRRTLHMQSNHGWKVHPLYPGSLLDLLIFDIKDDTMTCSRGVAFWTIEEYVVPWLGGSCHNILLCTSKLLQEVDDFS